MNNKTTAQGKVLYADSRDIHVGDMNDIPPVGTIVTVTWTDKHVCKKLTPAQQNKVCIGTVDGKWIMQLFSTLAERWSDPFDIVVCPFCKEGLP